jgi:Holliday junction DNA helicase RuvA
MISYLRGVPIEAKVIGNRAVLILEVNSLGYEVQIPPRMIPLLPLGESLQVFTHVQMREEQPYLYGFTKAIERDLFRQLITVSGVGAQVAIALIDSLEIEQLVEAIVTNNIKILTQAPGVGTKTAERLALELKTKLAKEYKLTGLPADRGSLQNSALQEDIEMTLLALGYSPVEVDQALTALSKDAQLQANPHAEDWIRKAIAWLAD